MRKFKEKFISAVLSITLVASLMASTVLPVSASSDTSWKEALEKTLDTLQTKYEANPSSDNEWSAFTLARSGRNLSDANDKYYENYGAQVNEADFVLYRNDSQFTQYSKGVLVLTSLGKDVTNVAGYNFLTKVKNYDKVVAQGLNGPIYALLALNSQESYLETSSDKALEEKYIDYIVTRAKSGGGWALSSSAVAGDSDVTAMALQALSPYYKESGYENVSKEIDKALVYLASIQGNSGAFATYGDETSESTSQVIVALTSLGIDPESRAEIPLACSNETVAFNKGSGTVVEGLLSYYKGDGTFEHIKGQGSNGMATNQAAYALVSLDRYKESKTSLFDLTDVTDIKGMTSIPASWVKGELSETAYTYNGASKTPTVTITYGGVKMSEGKDYTLERPSSSINPATYSVTAKGISFVGNKTFAYTITKANQTVSVSKSSYSKTYGNSAFSLGAKTSGNGKLTYKSSNSKVVAVSSTGKVTIKGCGKATITVTAASTTGYNKATKTVTIKVAPKKQAITSIKGKSKSFYVKWKKDSKVSGYQIMYAKNSKFTKSKHTVTVKSYKTYSKTIKKLSKNKTYYVKVRSYKSVGSSKIYGSWSKVKKIKTK